MIAKRKGVIARRDRKEAWSKGASQWEKKRIEGVSVGRTGGVIAKPISIKDEERKFGGCTLKAVRLIAGDLP